MTIEEKAQSYAGYNIPHSRDMVTIAKMNRRYDGFKAGARWMLDKAIKWLKENADGYDCSWDTGPLVDDFLKAMEE